MTRWTDLARSTQGDDYGRKYADRFAALAAQGEDIHGEGRLVERLRAAPARVLDAGCGTGRVAAWLAEQGYEVVGVDVDPEMVRVAREDHPDLDWREADLAELDLDERFDVVLMAGNIVPLLEPGTLEAVVASLARHLRTSLAAAMRPPLLVTGFGLDTDHLPAGCPVTTLQAYDDACAAAGLHLVQRWSGWEQEPWDEGGYAVSVHASE